MGCGGRKNLCRLLRSHLQEIYSSRLAQASDQGRAMACVAAHTSSNHWITTGNYTSFGEYRFALKARLNLLPTRTVRRRAGGIADMSCPKCHEEQETLAHVLNHCLLRHRRNKILGRLVNAIPAWKGQKFKEQVLPGDRSGLKPDLIILNDQTKEAHIVDVTVPFEGAGAFPAARSAKEQKYEDTAPRQRVPPCGG